MELSAPHCCSVVQCSGSSVQFSSVQWSNISVECIVVFSRPGKARGCSTNTDVHSLIKLNADPPPLKLHQ